MLQIIDKEEERGRSVWVDDWCGDGIFLSIMTCGGSLSLSLGKESAGELVAAIQKILEEQK